MNCPYCQTDLPPYGTDTFRCNPCGDCIFWTTEGKIDAIAINSVSVDGKQFAIYMDIGRGGADPWTTVSKYHSDKLQTRKVVIELPFVPDNWTPQTLPTKLKTYLWFI